MGWKWYRLRGLWWSKAITAKAVLIYGAEEWNKKLRFIIPAKGFRSWGLPFDYREEVEVAEWVLNLKPELKQLVKEVVG